MYGYLNSFRVFLEAAGMFCAPWLVNRIGAKNGLIFAGMVMALRMVASGLVEGPLLISITKLLHAVELPVLLVAIFKYNSLNFDKRLSSTLYRWALPAPARSLPRCCRRLRATATRNTASPSPI